MKKPQLSLYPNRSGVPKEDQDSSLVHCILGVFFLIICQNFDSGFIVHTPFLESFSAELLVYNEGRLSPAEAAFQAGYKTRPRQAASELRNPKVSPLVVKYIGELRSEIQEKYGISFERHISELAQIRNQALENKAWSAAVNAEVARGKAGGLYVDQKLVMTGNVDNMTPDEIKERLHKIINDNKEIINITPEDVKLEELELPKESSPDSD
jgi:hypothetical protein